MDWKKHYYSRVSLHEAPTKKRRNNRLIDVIHEDFGRSTETFCLYYSFTFSLTTAVDRFPSECFFKFLFLTATWLRVQLGFAHWEVWEAGRVRRFKSRTEPKFFNASSCFNNAILSFFAADDDPKAPAAVEIPLSETSPPYNACQPKIIEEGNQGPNGVWTVVGNSKSETWKTWRNELELNSHPSVWSHGILAKIMVNYNTLVKIMANHDTWNACQDYGKILKRLAWNLPWILARKPWLRTLGKLKLIWFKLLHDNIVNQSLFDIATSLTLKMKHDLTGFEILKLTFVAAELENWKVCINILLK